MNLFDLTYLNSHAFEGIKMGSIPYYILIFLTIFFCFELQNPMIFRQYLHLTDSDSIKFLQPFHLSHSLVDKHGIQILQI